MGWENIFHCEINPFARKVLEYHFPNSISYENIKTTDFTPFRGRIDILTGGFPCQPFSLAGRRKGADDDRYLWDEMLRAICEIQPTWIVAENVYGIASMVQPGEEVAMGCETTLFEENYIYRKEQLYTIEQICKDFEDAGYTVQPIVIPACAVGAPHRRDRVWFIANRADARIENMQRERENSIYANGDVANSDNTRFQASRTEQQATRTTRCVSGDSPYTSCAGRTRRSQQSNQWCSTSPQRTNILSRIEGLGRESTTTYTQSTGKQGKHLIRQREEKSYRRDSQEIQTIWHDFPTQSPVCSRDDGLSERLDGITFPRWREESIKAYGNAWVPQVAYEIFNIIEQCNGRKDIFSESCSDA